MTKVKIIKHTYCKRNPCPHLGMTGEVEETIVEPHTDKDGKQVEGKYWIRLDDGKIAKCDKSDFEEVEI